MRIEISGQATEAERYQRAVRGFIEHYDKLAVFSRYGDDRALSDGYPKSLLDDSRNQMPNSEWGFAVRFEDEDFGIWFKLKYG